MNLRDKIEKQIGQLVLANLELADMLEIERAKNAQPEKPQESGQRLDIADDGRVTAIR